MGALLRYFRDLDVAEESFQEACLRALQNWPKNGPPRDPTAWLIFVGRNAASTGRRRHGKTRPLPPEEALSDLDDAEAAVVEQLDAAHYRDDVLRLLFICCHPELPATQQMALALRIVCGLSVGQIARAFLVGEAPWSSASPAPRARGERAGAVRDARRGRARRAPGRGGRRHLLVFNEGYGGGGGGGVRAPLCEEAIRLGRLLLRCFPAEPEIMGLMALMLLQHSRVGRASMPRAPSCCWRTRTAGCGTTAPSPRAWRLSTRRCATRARGPYQVQAAIAAVHARAARVEDTDWARSIFYARPSRGCSQPSHHASTARSPLQAPGPAALEMLEPLGARSGYFHFFGVKGALLMKLGGTSRPASRSAAPLPWPTPPPRPRTSACTSTG